MTRTLAPGKWVLAWICLAGLCAVSPASANPAVLRDAKGLRATLFDEVSGHRYLELRYEEVKTEYPKIGFFRLGLPILKVKGLEVDLHADHADFGRLRDQLGGLARFKGIRFVLAEPARLRVFQKGKATSEIRASRAKMSADGSIRCYGGVTCLEGNATRTAPAVDVVPDEIRRTFRLRGPDGADISRIPLPQRTSKGPAEAKAPGTGDSPEAPRR